MVCHRRVILLAGYDECRHSRIQLAANPFAKPIVAPAHPKPGAGLLWRGCLLASRSRNTACKSQTAGASASDDQLGWIPVSGWSLTFAGPAGKDEKCS